MAADGGLSVDGGLTPQQKEYYPLSHLDDSGSAVELAGLVNQSLPPRFVGQFGIDAICALLRTNKTNGLDNLHELIAKRRESHGANVFAQPDEKPFYKFVFEVLHDFTMLVLLACAATSLLLGILIDGIKEGWYDGGSIIIAVILVVCISAFTNFNQAKQFASLFKAQNEKKVQVRRGGLTQDLSIGEVVVGDVVVLQTGCMVPADGMIMQKNQLELDLSGVTGEADLVKVDDSHLYLSAGDLVANGQGEMVVLAVGCHTRYGKSMAFVARETEKQTPLQARLEKLSKHIGKIGFTVAGVVLVALLIRYFTGITTDDEGHDAFSPGKTGLRKILTYLVKIFSAAATIVVVAVPEGLPLAVTLTLAFSMKKMMKEKAFVRNLASCETMGSATTICTDKTGTLTTGNMSVQKTCIGAELQESLSGVGSKLLNLLIDAIAWNTNARIPPQLLGTNSSSVDLPPELPGSDGWLIHIDKVDGPSSMFSGSPTEVALLDWAYQNMTRGYSIRTALSQYQMVEQDPFDSKKKRSSVVILKGSVCHVHFKGAVEQILEMCDSVYTKDRHTPLTSQLTEQISGRIRQYASEGFRCIGFAHSNVHERGSDLQNKRYTFIGLMGIQDPVRSGVVDAVRKCKDAGVTVRMVTGDYVETAKAISRKCEILTEGDEFDVQSFISGNEWRVLSQEDQDERCEKIRVMARALPEDKLKLVQALRRKNNVVAVTGDGTNDAQALKEADVGLSMGVRGTEVAKQASDIVILDDNFATVVTVLKWGRGVANNIKKFVQFQLTVNITALVLNLIAVVSSGTIPLTAVQLLWVNLIMDSFGALALASEAPTDELLKKSPAGRAAPMISRIMWRHMLSQSLFQVIVLLVLQFRGRSIFGVDENVTNTIIFNTFVFCQVFNEFNARQLEDKNIFKGLTSNKWFSPIIGFTVVLQAVLVEFLNKFARTVKLSFFQWFICIFIALFSWVIAFAVKFVPVIRVNFEI